MVTAFLTGLYFAILQFCYLILLQINVSSAYLTYMLIVVAWMTGSIAGLWWKKMNPATGVVLGGLSYYAVLLLVVFLPFETLTLGLSALGVMFSGLWAGRFFVVYLPRFGGADRLFFHENNGFLLGIVVFFVGFTIFGKHFLFLAPAVLACLLLIGTAFSTPRTTP
ncbi:MAG: hypothetical protein COV67_00630 [Nitrospinae bacterium CG11_big_fil_rev_8_21_14_0_20_56_8]|nr:MAG: hypothetical protein COV67_00630 [Nitrospinae bacterium CG11_big_fil_rev_8_21_14_0_20_56_8]